MGDLETTDGPLFIVGIPRSGTKLLRDLLNRNSQIGIPTEETGFIPGTLRKHPDISVVHWRSFYSRLLHTAFCWHMKKKGIRLSYESFDGFRKDEWSNFFCDFLSHFARAEKQSDIRIWGDKTPGYHLSMNSLKKNFPRAKFIHIIRDPRDCCLSIHRTWGKSMYRAAHRWARELAYARQSAGELGSDYKEIRYEALLESPEVVMRQLCEFIGSGYEHEMTELCQPSEHSGDAAGQTMVVKANTKKYRRLMTPTQLRRTEQIVYPMAKELRYDLDVARSHKPLSRFILGMLFLHDSFKILKFHMADKGVRVGIDYVFTNSR